MSLHVHIIIGHRTTSPLNHPTNPAPKTPRGATKASDLDRQNFGGWATPLKNVSSSIGMINDPNINGKMKLMGTKPPTSFTLLHFISFNFTTQDKHIS